MVKRTVADLKPYNAPGHFNMVAMRIHGKEETGAEKFWIGVSTFLPGGGAAWDESSPQEKVYYTWHESGQRAPCPPPLPAASGTASAYPPSSSHPFSLSIAHPARL